jgi:pyrimidine-nucleoside phosphorylase
MLRLGGVSKDLADARLQAETILDSGKGFDMFLRLVKAQGGDVAYVEEPGRLTKAALIETIKSHQDGYLTMVHAQTIGESAVELGAGRAKKGDPIDHSVGFEILRKVGDKISKGDPLFVIHASNIDSAASAKQKVLDAFAFSDEPVEPLPLFYDLVMSE